jgi:hypothetical protein
VRSGGGHRQAGIESCAAPPHPPLGIRLPVKVIRQLVSFVLGVTVGVCLYSLLKFRPLSPVRMADGSSQVGAYHPGKSLRPPWVQRSAPPQVTAPIRVHFAKHVQAMSPKAADVRPPARPKPGIVEVAASAASKNEVAAVTGPSAPPMAPTPQVSPAPPPPTVFKAIGYVEKAGGQLEAIILQEDQIQVVRNLAAQPPSWWQPSAPGRL